MHERPTDELRCEHELILLVAGAMEQEAGAIDAGSPVNRVRVAQMVDFAQNFTDRCHLRKEEEVLFPALADRSRAATEPVRTLVSDHRVGRDAVTRVDRALSDVDVDERDRTVVAANLDVYALLLRRHIAEEERILLPLAELVFSGMEQELVAREFRRIEELGAGRGEYDRYQALARQLARTAPAGSRDPRMAA